MKHTFFNICLASTKQGHGSLPEHNNANGEHSVSGDLHGVQPDHVAADILRKEPEHETFLRLRISPFGNLLSFFLFVISSMQENTYTQVFEN